MMILCQLGAQPLLQDDALLIVGICGHLIICALMELNSGWSATVADHAAFESNGLWEPNLTAIGSTKIQSM